MTDVLLLDSRDSFTWNLAHAFAEIGAQVRVVEASGLTLPQVIAAEPRLVCIGPGPRGPAELPELVALAAEVSARFPTFGVCLGLQALTLAHGGCVGRALAPVHGKRTAIRHRATGIFTGMPDPLWVMRYHSLIATRVPVGFSITATDAEGQPMAIRRARGPYCEALQFHPESIGTSGGLELLRHALRAAGMHPIVAPPRPGSIPPATRAGSALRPPTEQESP